MLKYKYKHKYKLGVYLFVLIFVAIGQIYLSAVNAKTAQAANPKLSIGDQVSVTTRSLSIRSGAGLNYRRLGVQAKNSLGIIIAGPKSASGDNWWKIDWNSGVDGWSSERYLALVSKGSILVSLPTPVPVPTPVPITTPAPTPTSTPAISAMQWGAFVGGDINDLANFESLTGKQVNIQAYFVGWGDDFPTAIANNLKVSGKTLLVFWEPYGTTVSAINAGSSDAYMAGFAAQAKAYGGSVILAPFHEMNGNWDPWDGYNSSNKLVNTPANLISAWKRIYNTFTNVPNVKFAWDVNSDSVPNISANDMSVYYPGDAYVDYVGVDGFNFNNPWQTFGEIFDSAISKLSVYNKPIYIFSMGSLADPKKAAWITDGLGSQIKKYNLVAWVWFNQNGPDGNWSVNSDSASLTAFKSILPK